MSVQAILQGQKDTLQKLGGVPLTRTINGKELDKDIVLSPEDVGAVSNDNLGSSASASGRIASFESEATNPISQVIVDIEPQQDLNGYDKPWPGGSGKNLLEIYEGMPTTMYGVTLSINTPIVGAISIMGTPTSDNGIEITQHITGLYGTYVLSGAPQNSGLRLIITNETGGTSLMSDTGNGATRNFDNPDSVMRCFIAGFTTGTPVNAVFYPMLRLASETDSTFEPYANICPITGWTEAEVTHTGKNLLKVENASVASYNSAVTLTIKSGVFSYSGSVPTLQPVVRSYVYGNGKFNSGGNYIETSDLTSACAMPIYAGTYSFNCTNPDNSHTRVALLVGEIGKTYRQGNRRIDPGKSFTVEADCYYCLAIESNIVQYDSGGPVSNFQLELEDTPTTYEPYTGTTLSVPLPGTIYGGKLNVTTGELVVDKQYFKITSASQLRGETPAVVSAVLPQTALLPSNTDNKLLFINKASYGYCTSDRVYIYGRKSSESEGSELTSDFFDRVGEIEVVYTLATPITYHLTSQQLTAFIGQNNISADTGSISIIYHPEDKPYPLTSSDLDAANGVISLAALQDELENGDLALGLRMLTTAYRLQSQELQTVKEAIVALGGNI